MRNLSPVLAAAIGVGSSDSPNPSARQSSAGRVGAPGGLTLSCAWRLSRVQLGVEGGLAGGPCGTSSPLARGLRLLLLGMSLGVVGLRGAPSYGARPYRSPAGLKPRADPGGNPRQDWPSQNPRQGSGAGAPRRRAWAPRPGYLDHGSQGFAPEGRAAAAIGVGCSDSPNPPSARHRQRQIYSPARAAARLFPLIQFDHL